MKSNRECATYKVMLEAAYGENGTSNVRYSPAVTHRIAVGCVRYVAIAIFVTVVVGGFPAMA